ncbi:hypothetical protein CC79DRAFT_1336181 [Sarocladium strictum]
MPRADARARGGVQACQRCRRRKQKCDQRFPQCSNCERVNETCLSFHSGKQADIPRDYVSRLENEIAELTKEIQVLRKESQDRSHTSSTFIAASTGLDSSAQPIVGRQREGYSSSARDEISGSSSSTHDASQMRLGRNATEQQTLQQNRLSRPGLYHDINLSRIVMSSIHMDQETSPAASAASLAATSPDQFPVPSPASTTNTSNPDKASLPPRHVADHLLEVYFQYRTPHMPIIGRVQAAEAVSNAYAGGSVSSPAGSDRRVQRLSQGMSQSVAVGSPKNLFIAYMIFAIALVDVPHTSGGRPIQSDGCFRSALVWIEEVLAFSRTNLELLRVVLLVTQFVALSPVRGSLWSIAGFAVRLCIDAGLHQETSSQISALDPKVLDDRRRLWHCACYFDRLLCITLGRPSAVIDDGARVKLPNPWHRAARHGIAEQAHDHDKHTQRAHNHLLKLSKLEFEIKRVVHNSRAWSPTSTAASAAFLQPNWATWWQEIQPRLQEWFDTIPEPKNAHPSSIFASEAYWDVIYHNASLQLHRPICVMPHPSFSSSSAAEELLSCFESSTRVISGLAKLQTEGRIEMLWRSVHQLFIAGLGVIYCLWNSDKARNIYPVSQSIATLKDCSETLWSMAETFPGAVSCRDTFNALSDATMHFLVAVGESDRVEETRRASEEFEMCVQGLRETLRLRGEPEGGGNSVFSRSTDHLSAILLAGGDELGEMLHDAAQWPNSMEGSRLDHFSQHTASPAQPIT